MIKIRYMKKRMTNRQFTKFLEAKVKNTIEKYKMVKPGERILVGLSGGKDSAVMLHIMNKILDNEIVGFFIDLGIPTFSEESKKKVIELTEKENVPLIIYDLKKEEGFSIPEAVEVLHRPACSICGTVKRYIINKFAWENKFDKIAMGHTADDETSNILKNFVNGDLEQFVRLGPTLPSKDKLVARIKPLYRNYDGENLLYARINEIPFVDSACPLAIKKKKYKRWVNFIEKESPGMKLTILKSYKKFKSHLNVHDPELKPCKICGYPTTNEVCSFCKIKEKLKEQGV